MAFTSSIVAAILAFAPVIPTLAIPLTKSNVNSAPVVNIDIAPIPVSVAPKGIMLPGPFNTSDETTKSGLPFDSHPDDLENFPTIEDIPKPTETTKTGFPFNSHSDDLKNFPDFKAASTGAPRRRRNRITKRPLIAEAMVGLDGAIAQKPKPTGPHRFGDQVPNFHPWGNIGGHRPVMANKPTDHAHPEDVFKEPLEPILVTSHLDKGQKFQHTPIAQPYMPSFGHGPVVNPGLSSRPLVAPTSTATFSNLIGGPIRDHTRLPKKNSTNSGLSDLTARDSQAANGLWGSIASAIVTTAVEAPIYVAEKTGDEVLAEHESEIESFTHKITHHPKHSKPSIPAHSSNSTSVPKIEAREMKLSNPEVLEYIAHVTGDLAGYPIKNNRTNGNPEVVTIKFSTDEALDIEYIMRILDSGNAMKATNATEIKTQQSMRAFLEALNKQIVHHATATSNAVEKSGQDDGHLEKRGQGQLFADTAQLDRMRGNEILVQIIGKIDRKGMQETCRGREDISGFKLVMNYVKKTGN